MKKTMKKFIKIATFMSMLFLVIGCMHYTVDESNLDETVEKEELNSIEETEIKIEKNNWGTSIGGITG